VGGGGRKQRQVRIVHETGIVRAAGDINWLGQHVFIGEALAGHTVGQTEQGPGYLVRFCTRDLGIIVPPVSASTTLRRRVCGCASRWKLKPEQNSNSFKKAAGLIR
jgi:hypothetical protein